MTNPKKSELSKRARAAQCSYILFVTGGIIWIVMGSIVLISAIIRSFMCATSETVSCYNLAFAGMWLVGLFGTTASSLFLAGVCINKPTDIID